MNQWLLFSPILCKNIHLAADELDVLRALRVTVASSVLGTSLVRGEPRHTTVLVHLREVDGAVETARKVRHVDVEGEFLVLEVPGSVLRLAVHQVDTRADVGRAAGVGDEVKLERRSASRDTVCALVVSTVESAVSSASHVIGAERRVPGVAGVAVGVAANIVDPAPVRVEDDLTLDSRAAGGRALRPLEGRVRLGRLCAGLLGGDGGEVDESGEGGSAEHCGVGRVSTGGA